AGLGAHVARISGRASFTLRFRGGHPEAGDAGTDHRRRRRRAMYRTGLFPEGHTHCFGIGYPAEERSRRESRGARPLQPTGRSFPRPGAQRQLVPARPAHTRNKATVASGTSWCFRSFYRGRNWLRGASPMLKWALIFLVIAVIAGVFGFSDVEAASATIAQWLFGIFVVLFLGALIIGLTLGAKLTS